MFKITTNADAVANMTTDQQAEAIRNTGIGQRGESDVTAFIARQDWRTFTDRQRAQQQADFYNLRAIRPYTQVTEII